MSILIIVEDEPLAGPSEVRQERRASLSSHPQDHSYAANINNAAHDAMSPRAGLFFRTAPKYVYNCI